MNTIETMIEQKLEKREKPFWELLGYTRPEPHPVLKMIEYWHIPRRLQKYYLLADSMYAHLVPMQVGLRILEEDIKEAPTEDKIKQFKELEAKLSDEYQKIYKGLKDSLRKKFWREKTINEILSFGARALDIRAQFVWDHRLSMEEGKSPLPNE